MLNTGHLIPCGTVVLGDLCLDHNFRIEFIGHDKVRCLIESRYALSALGLPEAYLGSGENALNRTLQYIPDQFTHRITVTGKWATEESLVQEHRIRNAKVGKRLDALKAISCIRLVEPVKNIRWAFRRTLH